MNLSKPRPEEVIIKIKKDPGRFTDVIVVLHAKGFFDGVWELKEIFDPHEMYPIVKKVEADEHFKNTYYTLLASDKGRKFEDTIRYFRRDFGLPSHYERMIHKLIFTGVIEDEDYRKAYYKAIPIEYDNEGNDIEELHSIIIHQGTREEDLVASFREYLTLYEAKTKTAKNLLPKDIKQVPDYIKPYISPENYNQFAVDGYSKVDKYYWCYQQRTLAGTKPQELALQLLSISKATYQDLLKSNDLEDQHTVDDIKREAKGISKGIERIEQLIHSK